MEKKTANSKRKKSTAIRRTLVVDNENILNEAEKRNMNERNFDGNNRNLVTAPLE